MSGVGRFLFMFGHVMIVWAHLRFNVVKCGHFLAAVGSGESAEASIIPSRAGYHPGDDPGTRGGAIPKADDDLV